MMTIEMFVIAALTVYRLTLLLSSEAGPADIFGRLRARMGVRYDEHSVPYGTNWLAEGILCFFCLSLWVSFGVIAIVLAASLLSRADLAFWVCAPFALSGGAVFLKKWTG